MSKYTLYHIKGVKWGMTEHLRVRLRDQGYTISDVYEFEYYNDLDTAADREKELNLRDGYGWNSSQDYRVIRKAMMARKHKVSQSEESNEKRRVALKGIPRPQHVRDIMDKHRPIGTDHHQCVLSEDDVREIRNKYIPYKYGCNQLSEEYGVHFTVINKIVRRKIWKHI